MLELSKIKNQNLPQHMKTKNIIRKTIHRQSYTSDHFIWNLFNEPLASLINLIWNDHECKILGIIWPFKCNFTAFKVCFISMKICSVVNDVIMMLLVPAESVM